MKALIIILIGLLALSATPRVANTVKPQVYFFLAAGCPCAYDHQQTFGSLIKKYNGKVDFFAVFMDKNDDQEEIEDMLKNLGWEVEYIVDQDKSLAKKYKPQVTTDCVLVSPQGSVLYKGAVDDGPLNYGQVLHFHLKDALEDYFAGREVKVKRGEGRGCIINWNQ